MEEIRSLKSIIQREEVSEESRSSVVSDNRNYNGMVKSVYDNIPQYDSEGNIQKLLDFIDKVEDYLAIADTMPMMEITLITTKMTGMASLLWRHHKHLYEVNSSQCITRWNGLKKLLMQSKVTKEQERYILSWLELLKQNESVQKYTTEFECHTMQIMDLPLTAEMHYYLKGLKLEI